MRYVNNWQKHHQWNNIPLGVWFVGSFVVDVIHECPPFLAQLLFVLFISLHLSLFREDFVENLLDERRVNHFCPSLCVWFHGARLVPMKHDKRHVNYFCPSLCVWFHGARLVPVKHDERRVNYLCSNLCVWLVAAGWCCVFDWWCQADASERLRQNGLSHIYPHPVCITQTRSCPLEPPPPPEVIPAWKLIRPRKKKEPPTDEPKSESCSRS